MSQVKGARSRVRADQCVFAFGAVELPELLCLRSSCSHVTEVEEPYGLWHSRWRVSGKMKGTWWK